MTVLYGPTGRPLMAVEGDVAHDVADSGNPVKIGGQANNSQPSIVSSGNRVNAWFGGYGQLMIGPSGKATPGDALTNTSTEGIMLSSDGTSVRLGVLPRVFNGTSWDRLRGTTNGLQVHGPVAADAAVAGNPSNIGLRASDAVPSAMSADGDSVFAWGDRYGRVVTTPKAGTATLTNVGASVTNVTVLAANTARLGGTIFNDSTSIVYFKFGATASTTSFTIKAAAASYYEVPFGYTGIIDGIWVSANGSARVTELT